MTTIDFFNSEVRRIQDRFNQAYEGQTVIHLKARFSLIMAIIGLRSQAVSIAEEPDRTRRTDLIQAFMRRKATIIELLDRIAQSKPQQKASPKPGRAAIA